VYKEAAQSFKFEFLGSVGSCLLHHTSFLDRRVAENEDSLLLETEDILDDGFIFSKLRLGSDGFKDHQDPPLPVVKHLLVIIVFCVP
jgi:hypothetical protein